MSRHISLRWSLSVLMAALVLPLTARGQAQDSQSQSVADAARRAREQKKSAAKPITVVTDDTLKPAAPAAQDANAPAAISSPSATGGSAAPAATPEDAEHAAKSSAELAALKQKIAEAQKGLDLLQREFALQQDTFYSNPVHDRDTSGKAKLDDMKQQILDKQQEVDALKTRLAALQESAGSPAPAVPTPPPPSPQS